MKFAMCAAMIAAASAEQTFKRVEVDKTTLFSLKSVLSDLKQSVRTIEGRLDVAASQGVAEMQAIATSVRALQPAVARMDGVMRQVAGVEADLVSLQEGIDGSLVQAAEQQDALLDQLEQDVDAAEAEMASTVSEAEEFTAGFGTAGELVTVMRAAVRVQNTFSTNYVADSKIPVFRWTIFSTYNQNCCWFDRDRTRAFGGVRPQQWGDGNIQAHQMNPDIRYLKRMFTSRATGDAEAGANACIENFMMPHSTDDKRCGALFRIKNSAAGPVTWRVSWTFTGWSGWGNQASVAVNKRNVWHGNCHHHCERTESIAMVPNDTRDRVSTVVFITGGSATYGHYNYYRTNMLSFNRMALPDGLDFVDDLDSATGSWA
jgi:hypothetical protein